MEVMLANILANTASRIRALCLDLGSLEWVKKSASPLNLWVCELSMQMLIPLVELEK